MGKKKIPVLTHQQPLQTNPWDALGLPTFPPPTEPTLGTPTAPAEIHPPPSAPQPRRHKSISVAVRRETSGRAGKPVLVLHQWEPPLPTDQLQSLLAAAKKALGCGGTVRDDLIELQLRDPSRLRQFLQSQGITPRGEI